MTPVVPLGDRILVKRLEAQKVRASGLVLPDSFKEQSDRAEVIAIGAGRQTETGETLPIEGIEIGDTVLFSPYSGSQVVVDDEEWLLLRAGDVLGVLTGLAVGEPGDILHVTA